jgi:hypothetical protein
LSVSKFPKLRVEYVSGYGVVRLLSQVRAGQRIAPVYFESRCQRFRRRLLTLHTKALECCNKLTKRLGDVPGLFDFI